MVSSTICDFRCLRPYSYNAVAFNDKIGDFISARLGIKKATTPDYEHGSASTRAAALCQ